MEVLRRPKFSYLGGGEGLKQSAYSISQQDNGSIIIISCLSSNAIALEFLIEQGSLSVHTGLAKKDGI